MNVTISTEQITRVTLEIKDADRATMNTIATAICDRIDPAASWYRGGNDFIEFEGCEPADELIGEALKIIGEAAGDRPVSIGGEGVAFLFG